jgi:hypothetical protein
VLRHSEKKTGHALLFRLLDVTFKEAHLEFVHFSSLLVCSRPHTIHQSAKPYFTNFLQISYTASLNPCSNLNTHTFLNAPSPIQQPAQSTSHSPKPYLPHKNILQRTLLIFLMLVKYTPGHKPQVLCSLTNRTVSDNLEIIFPK